MVKQAGWLDAAAAAGDDEGNIATAKV